ncbi:MAG TPA: helix-turn-helix domain-containing protein [Streptosporangiaceae bacterium]|nr:helix-turn-helix domain-containing protein [Streptosporangiaceae bacterium]
MAEQPALSFGGLLRRLRAEADLTQEELAEAARLSPRSVSDLERGLSRTARKDTAVLLAGALGLTGQQRELFVAAARGRGPVAEVVAARDGAAAAQSVLLTNLPVELSAFIGRDRELAEVRALVEASRLVTLTGAGGCGKTRLGLEVAAGLLGGFGDGVWLVELAAVTGGDGVAPAISGALRLTGQPGRSALDALLDALAPQDVLIVLDNCEHLIGGCARVAEAIVRRCRRVRLIATSREPLGIGGETIYRVPSLSLPGPEDCGPGSPAIESSDAVALFADRARAHGIHLSLDGEAGPLVVSVCRRLDGMPLAIELAAARLRSMSLAELNGRLDQRFRLLTGGNRTALERQQTLRATVGWSYSLLTDAEQLLLGRLSVFAGGFGLDAAEAVCGSGDIDVPEVAGLLGSLVDKSLVEPEPAGETLRYRLLETIRLFAAERLAETGDGQPAAVSAAHCAHYLALAETAARHLTGPEQGSWLARLDADQANLRRAAQHAAGRADGTALVLRLGVALDRYWLARSRLQQEASGLLKPALQRPDAADDPALFAAALATGAWVALINDITAALQFADQAVQLSRRLGDDRLLSRSLAALCYATYLKTGEPETGLPFGRESVERARRTGDDVLLARTMIAYIGALDPAGSGKLYAEAFACTERSGDHLINATLHNNAGDAALQTGDIPAARAHVEAALHAEHAIGREDFAATVNMGHVLRAEGDPDGARSMFGKGLRMSRRNGDSGAMADAILGLACLAGDAGDWYRAAVLHGAAQALLDRTGSRWQRLEARCRQDSLDQARGQLGDEQLEGACAKGMALGLDQALDLALHDADPA